MLSAYNTLNAINCIISRRCRKICKCSAAAKFIFHRPRTDSASIIFISTVAKCLITALVREEGVLLLHPRAFFDARARTIKAGEPCTAPRRLSDHFSINNNAFGSCRMFSPSLIFREPLLLCAMLQWRRYREGFPHYLP